MNLLYIKHRLTAHHIRYNRNRTTSIAICSCGWKGRFLRTKPSAYIRRLRCILGHQYEPWEPIEIGSVYQKDDGEWTSEVDEGRGETIGYIRSCDRCWKAESKD